jgi:hypothetical protein
MRKRPGAVRTLLHVRPTGRWDARLLASTVTVPAADGRQRPWVTPRQDLENPATTSTPNYSCSRHRGQNRAGRSHLAIVVMVKYDLAVDAEAVSIHHDVDKIGRHNSAPP